MINGKRYTTINTDAGVKNKQGAFAYWIRSENCLLKGSGKLQSTDSNEAELEAILLALVKTCTNEYLNTADIIVVNCDNINAIKKINSKNIEIKFNEFLTNINTKYSTNIKNKINFNKVYAKHVKGHSNKKTSRNWVNNYLDKELKKHY